MTKNVIYHYCCSLHNTIIASIDVAEDTIQLQCCCFYFSLNIYCMVRLVIRPYILTLGEKENIVAIYSLIECGGTIHVVCVLKPFQCFTLKLSSAVFKYSFKNMLLQHSRIAENITVLLDMFIKHVLQHSRIISIGDDSTLLPIMSMLDTKFHLLGLK